MSCINENKATKRFSQLLIRKAVIGDAPALGNVVVTTWRKAYKNIVPDEFLDNMSSEKRAQRFIHDLTNPSDFPYHFYVAEKDGCVIGFLSIGDYDGVVGSCIGEIGAIYLLPDFWGCGFGKQMMIFAIEALREAGYKEIRLWVFEENARTRRFYEDAGFKYTGLKKEKNYIKSLPIVQYALDIN